MIKSPLYRMGRVGKNIAGKEVRRYHSQKQVLLGAMMARSFDFELDRILRRKLCDLEGVVWLRREKYERDN